jgi:uncharacterized iron-regulated membrane protein
MPLTDLGLTLWGLVSIVLAIASSFYLYFGREVNEDLWADKRFRYRETRLGTTVLAVALASIGGWFFVVLS